ncbi:MAG: arginine N-succinyltransferase, partial [Chlamydiia bacterium]|nr:arginine N-succinyltransferase [Chlamydiia bacterium]
MSNSLLIRPVKAGDAGMLYDFASRVEAGLTTLRPDQKYIEERIQRSIASFSDQSVMDPLYVFILQIAETPRVLGTCSITPKTLGVTSGYYYQQQILPLDSQWPPNRTIGILAPYRETSLGTELGGLYLTSEMRHKGAGRLLSLSRMFFIAMYPERFDANIFAELRGVTGADSSPPFWRDVASHFIGGTFHAFQSSIKGYSIDSQALAPFPIFIPLLPFETQMAIGAPHPHAEGARRLLKDIGLEFSGLVDCTDAGPRYSADMRELYSHKKFYRRRVKVIRHVEGENTLMIAPFSSPYRLSA